MEKVVKCNKCGQYFMHTKKALKCPFCDTKYIEVAATEEGARPESWREKKASAPSKGGQASGSSSDGWAGASGGKDKKETAKSQKKSFKIWNGNYKK